MDLFITFCLQLNIAVVFEETCFSSILKKISTIKPFSFFLFAPRTHQINVGDFNSFLYAS